MGGQRCCTREEDEEEEEEEGEEEGEVIEQHKVHISPSFLSLPTPYHPSLSRVFAPFHLLYRTHRPLFSFLFFLSQSSFHPSRHTHDSQWG